MKKRDEVIEVVGYGDFLHEVKMQVRQRQLQALRAEFPGRNGFSAQTQRERINATSTPRRTPAPAKAG